MQNPKDKQNYQSLIKHDKTKLHPLRFSSLPSRNPYSSRIPTLYLSISLEAIRGSILSSQSDFSPKALRLSFLASFPASRMKATHQSGLFFFFFPLWPNAYRGHARLVEINRQIIVFLFFAHEFFFFFLFNETNQNFTISLAIILDSQTWFQTSYYRYYLRSIRRNIF